jgi:hypothetical protein
LKIGHGLLINTERKEKKVIFSVIGLICAMGFFLFGLGRAQGAENVTSLTADILHAYGGRKVLENVRSVYMKGKIRAFAFDDKGTYEYYLKRGRKLRVNVRYTRSTEERILKGNKGYESSGAGFTLVSGERYLGVLYQYKQIDLPYSLLNDEYKISYQGKEDVSGRKAYVLGLDSAEGPYMTIYVDAKSFFIIKVSGLFSMGSATMTLSAEFSDFRRVQGIMLPYQINNFAGNQKIAETAVEKYEINRDIEDSLFQPRH